MPAVLVKFYGPTEHKGTRFSLQAQGFPRKTYDRTHYELDPSEEIRLLAVRYAREVFKWENPVGGARIYKGGKGKVKKAMEIPELERAWNEKKLIIVECIRCTTTMALPVAFVKETEDGWEIWCPNCAYPEGGEEE